MKTKKLIRRLSDSIYIHKQHILIVEAELNHLKELVHKHGCSKVQH
jgi:hypothetical protein